jgi:hypothetical protein
MLVIAIMLALAIMLVIAIMLVLALAMAMRKTVVAEKAAAIVRHAKRSGKTAKAPAKNLTNQLFQ